MRCIRAVFGKTYRRIDPEKADLQCLFFGASYAMGLGWLWVLHHDKTNVYSYINILRYNTFKRRDIRRLYRIKGSLFGDCCTSYWCMCCALVQQENEANSRPPITTPYPTQPPMTISSQLWNIYIRKSVNILFTIHNRPSVFPNPPATSVNDMVEGTNGFRRERGSEGRPLSP